MKINYISADSRGEVDYGWLKSSHTYSFGNYYHPHRIGFGTLRVINDDIVAAGKGFGKHAHSNMEIISLPTEGQLAHSDSMNNKTLITTGEVQAMSAGTGVIHSELNASQVEPVKFFQIWIETRTLNIQPHYSQKKFSQADRKNKWQLIVAPQSSKEDVVKIHQDAWFSLGDFDAGSFIQYTLKDPTNNGVFLLVIEGEVTVGGQVLYQRDGLEIENTESILLQFNKKSALLLMEIPLT